MLRTDGLHKAFGALAVARDVNLRVAEGARHALIGPNGAGKTSLFNMVTGALRPDAGRVLMDGRDITRLAIHRRARIGLARSHQRNSLFDGMSVRENLATALTVAAGRGANFWRARSRETQIMAAAARLADQVDVTAVLDQPVSALAYGVQRQLEVGLALAGRPRVLLLDEPTAGMSPDETAAMQALIAGFPDDLTVVIIEHDMDLVFDLADRVTVMDAGTILFEGTPEEVRQSELVRRRYLGDRA